jgi:hypothetical protein
MAANVAQGADTYGDVCTGCHQASANGPPLMPSQDATFGKIMAETGQFEDSCTATFNCVLRQRLKGENSSGTIVNASARANMLSLATDFDASELEAVRIYLLKVRDLEVAAPSPSFTFASTSTASNSTLTRSVAIANWRAASVNYGFSITARMQATSRSCRRQQDRARRPRASSPPTHAARACRSDSLQGAAGARSATLRLTFTVAGADPVPFQRTFALSGTGVTPAPIFDMSPTTLTMPARIGTPTTGTTTITNQPGRLPT